MDKNQIANDIEHIMFVDHEEDIPMELYTKLKPVVNDITQYIVTQLGISARQVQNDVVRDVAIELKKEVGNIVYKGKTDIKEEKPKVEVEAHRAW